jgi:hypothetical protein
MGNIENQSGGLDEECRNGKAAKKYAEQHPPGKKAKPDDSKQDKVEPAHLNDPDIIE